MDLGLKQMKLAHLMGAVRLFIEAELYIVDCHLSLRILSGARLLKSSVENQALFLKHVKLSLRVIGFRVLGTNHHSMIVAAIIKLVVLLARGSH